MQSRTEIFTELRPVLLKLARQILFHTLRDALGQLHQVSDDFALFPIGRDYTCVARSGSTVKRAVVLRVTEQKAAAVRLVICPVVLRELEMLMTFSPGGEESPGNIHQNN